jgi:hypothetical protein
MSYTNTPDPTKTSMGFGGWQKVTSVATIGAGVKIAVIANVSESAATVTFTSIDYGSGNTETITDLSIGAGTILPGLFTAVSCSAGEILVSFQLGQMPA